MNTFDEREKGFEAKFKHDQDLEFKIRAKRNKLLALWAAEKVQPINIDDYVIEVRQSDLEKPGDDDIIDKLLKDFKNKSLNINRDEIINKIKEFENDVRSNISNS